MDQNQCEHKDCINRSRRCLSCIRINYGKPSEYEVPTPPVTVVDVKEGGKHSMK